MPLDSASLNPVHLDQERPELEQKFVLGSGLSRGTILRPSIWPVANENAKPRKGLIDGFVKTCERWRLSRSQQIILLGYPDSEIAAIPILDGRAKASQDVRDRTGYVLSISIGLSSIFGGSIASEVAWLNAPHVKLANLTPLQKMLSGRMTDMIKVNDIVLQERAL